MCVLHLKSYCFGKVCDSLMLFKNKLWGSLATVLNLCFFVQLPFLPENKRSPNRAKEAGRLRD